jgi:hypothetical protein
LPERLAHLLFAVQPDEKRHEKGDLRVLAHLLLQVAPGQMLNVLVLPAHLDVGLDGNAVVGLRERIQQFVQADGLVRLPAFGEVFALQHLRDRHPGGQGDDLGEVQFAQPLAVEAHHGLVPIQDPRQLVHVGRRVRLDLFFGKHRARRGTAGRVADQCGVVADDEHDRMAQVLELAQFAQHDREAQVNVGRGRVETQLDVQRLAGILGFF